jgi:hypothetical protein
VSERERGRKEVRGREEERGKRGRVERARER